MFSATLIARLEISSGPEAAIRIPILRIAFELSSIEISSDGDNFSLGFVIWDRFFFRISFSSVGKSVPNIFSWVSLSQDSVVDLFYFTENRPIRSIPRISWYYIRKILPCIDLGYLNQTSQFICWLFVWLIDFLKFLWWSNCFPSSGSLPLSSRFKTFSCFCCPFCWCLRTTSMFSFSKYFSLVALRVCRCPEGSFEVSLPRILGDCRWIRHLSLRSQYKSGLKNKIFVFNYPFLF